MRIEFTVLGTPQPQGSKTVAAAAGRKPWVRDDNRALAPWRDSVAAAAQRAMDGHGPLEGPLALEATFVFARPKAHFRTGRHSNEIKLNAPTLVATRPDADKLVRAVGDAITGIVCRDDAAFAVIHAEKHYGEPPCAFIRIRAIDDRPEGGDAVLEPLNEANQRSRAEAVAPRPVTRTRRRRYATIVADPPWYYHSFPRGAEKGIGRRPLPYPSMSLGEMADLPVREWADDDAFLFLWTTNRYLPDAFWIAQAWGFLYRQTIVWDKGGSTSPFTGSVAANRAEYLLVCRRGQPRIKDRWPEGCVVAVSKGEHSAKPEVFLDLVEHVAPGPYLEMFARRQRLGWDTWGNEALDHLGLAGS